jgi:DNA-binding XRE family transcriptional regulator
MRQDLILLADIKSLRQKLKISRSRMARELQIHRNTLMRIERGDMPCLCHAILIAEYLGKNIASIWWAAPPVPIQSFTVISTMSEGAISSGRTVWAPVAEQKSCT